MTKLEEMMDKYNKLEGSIVKVLSKKQNYGGDCDCIVIFSNMF